MGPGAGGCVRWSRGGSSLRTQGPGWGSEEPRDSSSQESTSKSEKKPPERWEAESPEPGRASEGQRVPHGQEAAAHQSVMGLVSPPPWLLSKPPGSPWCTP